MVRILKPLRKVPYYPPTHTLHKPVSPTWRGKSHATLNTDAVSLEIDEAAQAPAPRGFARPGDMSAGGGVV